MSNNPAVAALDLIAAALVLAVLLGFAAMTAGVIWLLRRDRQVDIAPVSAPTPSPVTRQPGVLTANPSSPWARPVPPPPPAAPRVVNQVQYRPETDSRAADLGSRSGEGEAISQRAALLAGIVELRGLLDDDLSTGLLTDTLCRGGVTMVDPVGDRVDPRRHRVDHTVAAPDPGRDGLIAATLSPCYLDGDRVLRPADVVVYRWNAR